MKQIGTQTQYAAAMEASKMNWFNWDYTICKVVVVYYSKRLRDKQGSTLELLLEPRMSSSRMQHELVYNLSKNKI